MHFHPSKSTNSFEIKKVSDYLFNFLLAKFSELLLCKINVDDIFSMDNFFGFSLHRRVLKFRDNVEILGHNWFFFFFFFFKGFERHHGTHAAQGEVKHIRCVSLAPPKEPLKLSLLHSLALRG